MAASKHRRNKVGEHPLPVAGIELAAAAAQLRDKDREDLALIALPAQAVVATVLTQNQFAAAPVQVTRKHLAQGAPRYLLINSAYANAGLGEKGINDALQCCAELAALTSVPVEAVLPFSTGIIGQPLPMDKLVACLPQLVQTLSPQAWLAAAQAMMTTDTVPKWESESLACRGQTITITGIAKGAGMICPNLATMLAFIATDLCVDQQTLQGLLKTECDASFNAISVDGDTSTNDAVVLIASGASICTWDQLDRNEKEQFQAALQRVFSSLSRAIVRDAEGGKHTIQIDVDAASDTRCAETLARILAHSPLIKTAMSAGDPNWGRVLAAIGRAPFKLDTNQLRIYFGEVLVFEKGAVHPNYREEDGVRALSGHEIYLRVSLGSGSASARVLTSDLTTEYVEINANYRS